MKRQIRTSVFETNSSSTHSVSIFSRKTRKYSDIPKNTEIIIDGSYEYGTDIFDEMGKLNYIVTMLASIVEYKLDCDELEEMSFNEMVKLNWFEWLAEVIKEESNTDVIYKCPVSWRGTPVNNSPYYDTTYDEDSTIEYIFTDGDLDIMNNEEKFKERVKEIIYTESIVIEDKENEY